MAKLNEHVVITTQNLAKGKPVHGSSDPDTVGPDEANDGDFGSSWYLDEGQTSGWLEVDLIKQESFNVLSLVEPVGGGMTTRRAASGAIVFSTGTARDGLL